MTRSEILVSKAKVDLDDQVGEEGAKGGRCGGERGKSVLRRETRAVCRAIDLCARWESGGARSVGRTRLAIRDIRSAQNILGADVRGGSRRKQRNEQLSFLTGRDGQWKGADDALPPLREGGSATNTGVRVPVRCSRHAFAVSRGEAQRLRSGRGGRGECRGCAVSGRLPGFGPLRCSRIRAAGHANCF